MCITCKGSTKTMKNDLFDVFSGQLEALCKYIYIYNSFNINKLILLYTTYAFRRFFQAMLNGISCLDLRVLV